MQQQQLQRIEVTKRSVFEEVQHLLPALNLTKQSLEFKTLERELRKQNGGIIQCQEMQQACWIKVLRVPREYTIERHIAFKVLRMSDRRGQTCIKIYAQLPQHQEQRKTVKIVVRLPPQLFCEQMLHLQQTRLQLTSEGLVLIKVPIRSEHLVRFSQELQQLPRNTIVVVKSRQQRLFNDTCSQPRSIFEELEEVVCRKSVEGIEQWKQWQKQCDWTKLEQLVQKHNNRWEQEWITFVPMQQAVQRDIIFRVKRNEQSNTKYIKIIGRKQQCQSKMCIKVRLPVELQKHNDELKQMRIQLTREGLVLIRVPIRRMDVFSEEQRTTRLTILKKQCIEVSPRSIFEELKHLIRREQQQRQWQQSLQQQVTLELLEQLLRERDNIVLCQNQEQETYVVDAQQSRHCWTKIVRPGNNMENSNTRWSTFKIEQCGEEKQLVLVQQTIKKHEQLQDQLWEQKQRIVVRLPIEQQQCRFDIEQTRVLVTCEGLVLVRVPIFGTVVEQQQLSKIFAKQCSVITENCNEDSEIINSVETVENRWGIVCTEMHTIQRNVMEQVMTKVQREMPSIPCTPRFTFMRSLLTCRQQPIIQLDMRFPTSINIGMDIAFNNISPEDVIVKTSGQTIYLQVRCRNTGKVNKCTMVFPEQVCVDMLMVTLSPETGLLRCEMPVELKTLMTCEEQLISKSNISDKRWIVDTDKTIATKICVEKMC